MRHAMSQGKQSVGEESASYAEMLATVQAFHAKHRFKETGGEDMTYRVVPMAEDLDEVPVFADLAAFVDGLLVGKLPN